MRALALLPVFVINFASFGYGYETSSLGLTTPQGSWLAIITVWLISFLLQAKGITLLTFLVAVSFVMSERASRRRDMSDVAFASAQRRRILKQALLGLAHGAFLYFGDILFSYALTSLLLLKLRRWKTSLLLRVVLALFGFALMLNLISIIIDIAALRNQADVWLSTDQATSPLTDAESFSELWQLNLENWFMNLSGQVILVPFYFLPIMLLGMVAGRLRWLTHTRWHA